MRFKYFIVLGRMLINNLPVFGAGLSMSKTQASYRKLKASTINKLKVVLLTIPRRIYDQYI